MPQAGMHGLAGLAVRRWAPTQEWLALGIVLGNMFPDTDNLAVAFATVASLPTHGLHRTFTHSVFTIAVIVISFYVVSWATKEARWRNLGIGLGFGVTMHILFDLILWFNGVELLWPIPLWVNLWSNVTPPVWWTQLMLPAEFLLFALFFLFLGTTARRRKTDTGFLPTLRIWTGVQFVLFIVFTALVYTLETGFLIPYGLLYLVSLGVALWVTIRMRRTVEAAVRG